MIFSPLEQFQIYPLFQINLGLFDISITNAAILFLLTISSMLFLLYSIGTENTMYLVPNRIQYIFELLYETTSDLLSGIVGPTGKYYFPYVFSIFTFILTANVIGLVPLLENFVYKSQPNSVNMLNLKKEQESLRFMEELV